MTDPAVIQASYHEFKMVKTRSALQLIFEVPIEQADRTFQVLGFPQPGQEQPVAIALLKGEATTQQSPEPKPSRSWYEIADSNRSAILCQALSFWNWIEYTSGGAFEIESEAQAREWLLHDTGATSRADFDSDEALQENFRAIETDYRQWAGLEASPEPQEQVCDSAVSRPPLATPDAEPEGADKAQQAPSVLDTVKLAMDQCLTVAQLNDCAHANNFAVRDNCTEEERKALTAHYRACKAKLMKGKAA